MQAYRIDRSDNSARGCHFRTHSSLERLLNEAPYPPASGSKRRPKIYHNLENPQILPAAPAGTQHYEYPSMAYPYHDQNRDGKVPLRDSMGNVIKDSTGKTVNLSPEYTRTLTDQHKRIQAVVYHPYNKYKAFVVAKKVFIPRSQVQRHSKRSINQPFSIFRRCRGYRKAKALKREIRSWWSNRWRRVRRGQRICDE